MFEVKIGSFDNKDLMFQLDMDDSLWIVVRPIGTSDNTFGRALPKTLTTYFTGEYKDDIPKFVDVEIIPLATKAFQEYFGKDATPPATLTEKLRAELMKLTIDTNTMVVGRK